MRANHPSSASHTKLKENLHIRFTKTLHQNGWKQKLNRIGAGILPDKIQKGEKIFVLKAYRKSVAIHYNSYITCRETNNTESIERSNHGLRAAAAVFIIMLTDYVGNVEVNGQSTRSRLLRHWRRSEEISEGELAIRFEGWIVVRLMEVGFVYLGRKERGECCRLWVRGELLDRKRQTKNHIQSW